MGKIAFVFPGQGAQYPGMGRELAENSPAGAEIFRKADALRPGTSQQCFSGTEQELRQTGITQPCLFAVELAYAAALAEKGITADALAGFSLGELAALAAAGCADFETCFRLVCRRGQLMEQAASEHPASMCAVVRLEAHQLEALCAAFDGVYPVNYNCPGQISVAAREDAMPAFSAAVKAAGGRAIPLKVSGGFHSPFMQGAADAFREELDRVCLRAPGIPLYANLTGLPYGDDLRQTLSRQICSPVRWESIIRHMCRSGIDTFIEVGPGTTLSGLISKIDNTARVLTAAQALEETPC